MKNILIVDDSLTNLLLLQNILEEEGYHVLKTTNVKDSIKIINANKIDLILLDIMMPGENGFNLLEQVKCDNNSSNIPIIMVTAKNNKEDREKAKKLGAIDYVEKPIEIDDIIARIKKVL